MTWEQGERLVGGVRLRYRRSRAGGPPLVLVHGMTDDGGYWARVARALEGACDLLVYDMRGHGGSDAPEAGYAPDDYAGDLLGLIAALGIERPLVVGHSLGAATTAAAAARAPQALRAVVLEDPPWNMPSGSGDPAPALAFAEAWRASTLELQSLDHAGRVARCRAEHPTWPEEECALWAESKRMVRPQIFSGFLPMMAQPWQQLAAQISCPALLLRGDTELGGIITAEVAERFCQLAPHGRALHIPGAGHAIHREQLDAFVAAVRGMLEGGAPR